MPTTASRVLPTAIPPAASPGTPATHIDQQGAQGNAGPEAIAPQDQRPQGDARRAPDRRGHAVYRIQREPHSGRGDVEDTQEPRTHAVRQRSPAHRRVPQWEHLAYVSAMGGRAC